MASWNVSWDNGLDSDILTSNSDVYRWSLTVEVITLIINTDIYALWREIGLVASYQAPCIAGLEYMSKWLKAKEPGTTGYSDKGCCYFTSYKTVNINFERH